MLDKCFFVIICQFIAWQPTPVFLPGESPRTEEPDGQNILNIVYYRKKNYCGGLQTEEAGWGRSSSNVNVGSCVPAPIRSVIGAMAALPGAVTLFAK